MPRSPRATISIAALFEKTAMRDTTAKAADPISRSRRRPMRSPRAPMIRRAPAAKNP
jgi:hypothetical protein